MIGQTIAHYRITAKLGEGGMGAVYRATDTKLNREVAIKVLPEAFRSDTERMARFALEAQILASLNHPNIAAIYGVEDRALVMELVEGRTLAGLALPVAEAMDIGRQIAEALEAAHERGIVHRDLKPANIKITPDGKVKVLDFGLAKAMLSDSPTIRVEVTGSGVILGTIGYMSPEQARGKAVDKRADIWAFGVVLYELLTGQRAFGGETATDAIAAIVNTEPDWSALPPGAPIAMLRRCLEKDPKRRLRDIGDAFADIASETAPRDRGAAARGSLWQRVLPWAATGLALIAVVLASMLWRVTRPAPNPLMRLTLDLGPDAALDLYGGAAAILSPDGTRLVFARRGSDHVQRLYTRRLGETEASPIPGAERAFFPFFSPDGQWVGFFSGDKLKKIPVQGGVPVTLCEAADARGGSWGEDGHIVFAPEAKGGLSRVSAEGGSPKPITDLNERKGEATHRWPQVLPGGNGVLFTAHTSSPGFNQASIEVHSLAAGQRKTLAPQGYYGRYVPSGLGSSRTGHLVFVHRDTLFAAPMDLARLELTGPAAPVLDEVRSNPNTGGAQFDFSRTGTFAFVMGKAVSDRWSLMWLDSAGKTESLRRAPADYTFPRFSPDGTRLALVVSDGRNADLWVYEWERDTMSRVTAGPGFKSHPVWAPDGRHIVFASENPGAQQSIEWIRADGSGEPHRLIEGANRPAPYCFSPDGTRLVYNEFSPDTGNDIWTVPLKLAGTDRPKPGNPTPFLRTSFSERYPALSSDGRWLAYVSDESGGAQVLVRPFPGPSGKWPISTGGGTMPVWSSNGRDLFFQTPDNLIMVAAYTAKGEAFIAEKPRLWSDKQIAGTGTYTNFDLAPDGRRFAVLLTPEGTAQPKAATQLTFLLNFFDELRRRDAARPAQ